MTRQPQPAAHLPDRRGTRGIIALAALIAVVPLAVHGCSCGHDFDFHLLNWVEAATQFAHGNAHPHWAYTPAYNAGEPRFVFYPPLSWYLGALLGLILTHLPHVAEAAGWTATPILYTWLVLTASGLAMHRLARAFVPANAALLAATLYLANPYMLFTAYERTAYAELLAAVWIPLLFLGILRPRITAAGIAIPLALLWLTNAPAAVMSSYSLAFLALVRIVQTRRERSADAPPLVIKTLAGTALGLSLAAFYIVPAAYERRFVRIAMVIIPGLRIQDNFLFHHTTGPDAMLHDLVLHTASVVAMLVLIATVVALLWNFMPRLNGPSESTVPAVPLAMLAAAVVFLLTPLSLFFWNHAPQAVFLQFPWRLTAILATACALIAAGALSRIAWRPVRTAVAALGLTTALVVPAYRVFQQRCFVEDTPAARVALFHSAVGTDPTDEYTPATADNDALGLADPPYWLGPSPTAVPPASQSGGAPSHLVVTASAPETLILNRRDFPGWRITRNGSLVLQRLPRPDGLIAIPVPAGVTTIDLSYTSTSRDQIAGDALSLAALIVLPFAFRRRRGL